MKKALEEKKHSIKSRKLDKNTGGEIVEYGLIIGFVIILFILITTIIMSVIDELNTTITDSWNNVTSVFGLLAEKIR